MRRDVHPRPGLLLTATLIAGLFACAEDRTDEAPPASRRLPVVMVPHASAPPVTTIRKSFDLADSDHGGFVRRSETATLVDPDGYLFASNGPQGSIDRRVHFDTREVSTLRVTTRSTGDARLRFEWLALDDSKIVRGLIEFRVDGGDVDRISEVDLRASPDWRGTTELISLHPRNRRGPIVVSSIALTQTPPDPSQLAKLAIGDGMVFLGPNARRAVPLVANRGSARIEGVLEPGESIEFEVGIRATAQTDVPPRLTLLSEDTRIDIPIEATAGWSGYRCQIPPSAESPSARDGTWSFELDGSDENYVFVTDAWRVDGETAERASPTAAHEGSRPNILLITADTLRRDILSIYGDPITFTPALDQLARDGVVFDDVTTAANVTLPSHASILSSLYPKDHGCLDNVSGLVGDVDLLPEILAGHGYATGAVIGSVVLSAGPTNLAQGFDEFHQLADGATRDADAVTDDAISFIGRHHKRPFFLWVHYYDPHTPYSPAAEDIARYYTGDPTASEHGLPLEDRAPGGLPPDITDLQYPIALYRGEITAMDREIGRMLRALDDTSVDQNTFVAFTADHGESLTENDIFFNHAGIFPNTIRVPWILRGPGVPAGSRVVEPMETIDIAPTLLRAIGIEPPSVERGYAWAPGTTPPKDRPRFFQHSNGFSVGMRTSRFHAVLHLRDHLRGARRRDLSAGQVELFLREIPAADSSDDISKSRPDDVRAFRQQIARWLADTVGFEGIDADLTEERERALRELGYLGG